MRVPKLGDPAPTGPSPSPFPRYGHSLPAVATSTGELFLFGGLVRETVRNDLYLFSTRDLSATLLETAGEVPSPRVGHASALVSSVLIVWGGDTSTSNPTDKQDNDLYLLNLGTYRRRDLSSLRQHLTAGVTQFLESGPASASMGPVPPVDMATLSLWLDQSSSSLVVRLTANLSTIFGHLI
jgi:hypothetical protein